MELYTGTDLIVAISALIIALLFAITIHEYAHAYMAYLQGDLTAKAYGRLSLNPFKHIDLIGFLMLFFVGFGFAKPVPINDLKFKNYRQGIFLVSIAGVTANFITFFFCIGLWVAYVLFIAPLISVYLINFFVIQLLSWTATISISLAIFNLLPIYPLDGFNFVTAFTRLENPYISFMKRYGVFILLLIFITPVMSTIVSSVSDWVIVPVYNFWLQIILGIF